MSFAPRGLALSLLTLLAACAAEPVPQPLPPAPPPTIIKPAPPPLILPPPVPPGPDALATGVTLEPAKMVGAAEAVRALEAFKASCSVLTRRADPSRLATGSDWRGVCAEAASLDPAYAPGFFYHRFDWVRIGDGRAFATGYYEPEIEGSRTFKPGYVPVHRTPSDLVRCTRAGGKQGRGRIDANGNCLLYHDRAAIEDGVLNGRGLELAWAKDPVELFFLEIQGSGRIRLDDGSIMRVGYDSQNGRDYTAIGKLLRDRGILQPGAAGMKEIKAWIAANPVEGRALMRENASYVFFRELTGPGPLGALGIAVTPRGTVAADPKYVPLGAPIFIDMDRNEADGLWIAQDTGGAIKGPNRFDTFWGAGAEAAALSGSMSASGQGWLLLPKGVGSRIVAAGAQARP